MHIEPTYRGYIEDETDALLILQAVVDGYLQSIPRRLYEIERPYLILSGGIFVFIEEISGVKRWTDGISWSPSRISGKFLIYREINKFDGTSLNSNANRPYAVNRYNSNVSLSDGFLPLPNTAPQQLPLPLPSFHPSGPLNDLKMKIHNNNYSNIDNINANGNGSYNPKKGNLENKKYTGFIKKTISVKMMPKNSKSPQTLHVVSYYHINDIKAKKLIPLKNDMFFKYNKPSNELIIAMNNINLSYNKSKTIVPNFSNNQNKAKTNDTKSFKQQRIDNKSMNSAIAANNEMIRGDYLTSQQSSNSSSISGNKFQSSSNSSRNNSDINGVQNNLVLENCFPHPSLSSSSSSSSPNSSPNDSQLKKQKEKYALSSSQGTVSNNSGGTNHSSSNTGSSASSSSSSASLSIFTNNLTCNDSESKKISSSNGQASTDLSSIGTFNSIRKKRNSVSVKSNSFSPSSIRLNNDLTNPSSSNILNGSHYSNNSFTSFKNTTNTMFMSDFTQQNNSDASFGAQNTHTIAPSQIPQSQYINPIYNKYGGIVNNPTMVPAMVNATVNAGMYSMLPTTTPNTNLALGVSDGADMNSYMGYQPNVSPYIPGGIGYNPQPPLPVNSTNQNFYPTFAPNFALSQSYYNQNQNGPMIQNAYSIQAQQQAQAQAQAQAQLQMQQSQLQSYPLTNNYNMPYYSTMPSQVGESSMQYEKLKMPNLLGGSLTSNNIANNIASNIATNISINDMINDSKSNVNFESNVNSVDMSANTNDDSGINPNSIASISNLNKTHSSNSSNSSAGNTTSEREISDSNSTDSNSYNSNDVNNSDLNSNETSSNESKKIINNNTSSVSSGIDDDKSLLKRN